MRNIENWETRVRDKILQQLPPRLREDVIKFKPPNKNPISYYLHGELNTGKTVMAAQLWLKAHQKKYLEGGPGKIIFISVPEFFVELKSTYNNPELDELVVLAKYAEAEFLVLDDLGSERSTDWVMSLLYLLINRRYENMLTTVITSNYDLDELGEKLDDWRIPSRIQRMCKILKLK